MSYCLNFDCQKPQNPAGNKFCSSCGTKLLLADRYRALKPIGQGGFGRTFLAVDEYKPSKPRCAIKQFFPQAQGTNNVQKAAALFEQEAVRLDELGHHPQIPELMAYFTQDQRQYLVQEFIDGQNLAQQLEQEGAFNEGQIRHLLNDLLPVLQFVHERRVIHRDIKPENIISHPGVSKLFLVDFGAAKITTGTVLPKTGTVIGSAGYAAPEQAVGKAIFASDLYSLGVTCIHLLTQVAPFDLYSVSEGNWVWRDYLQTSVSDTLGQILDKMLESGTRRRYQSAEEIIKDLNPQLTPVASKPAKQVLPPAQQVAPVVITPASNSQAQIWKCVKTLSGHSDRVLSVAISPDGQTLASCGWDYTIKIWHLEAGELIRTQRGHSNWVRAVTFSPDGQILASGSDDNTIKLWNLGNGQEIDTLRGHSGPVTSVVISPDGQTLASGSDDNTIKLWNIETGQRLCNLQGHSQWVQSVAFSPDGQTLASGACDGTIKIWDLGTGQEIRTISGATSYVWSVAISPDGQILASSGFDCTVKLWRLVTGELLHTLSRHSGWADGVKSIAISPDGQTLASGGGADKIIKIWHLATGKLLQTFSGHSKGITSVVFSPDGQTLVSGSYDTTIKIWQCD